MNNLKSKTSLLFTIGLLVSGVLGYFTFKNFKSYSEFSEHSSYSLTLISELRELNGYRFNKKTFAKLQTVRKSMTPAERQLALSDVLQSYSSQNPSLLRKRVRHFIGVERSYQKYLSSQLQYFKQQILFYGALTFAWMALFLISTQLFFRNAIFKPLASLHRQMTDFLYNRYTYRFGVPSDNELGRLHATFNSLAQQAISSMEELKSLDQAKSEFLNIASHELRTPLTSIKGSLSLLKTGIAGDLNPQAKTLTDIAEQETNRLIRLINELLDLAKIEAKRFPLEKSWSPLEGLLNNTIQGIMGLARQADVRVVCTGAPAVEILMDLDKIQQVLTNLVSNAIKYSPSGGVVSLHAEAGEQGALTISVNDQGRGIPPEDQELIFEKFRQATGPQNPLVKGTGLGLAIAKALIDEHNGEIGVSSKSGQGSTFYFTLPDWRAATSSKSSTDQQPNTNSDSNNDNFKEAS